MSTIMLDSGTRVNYNGNITTRLTPVSSPTIDPDNGIIIYWADVTPAQAKELLKMNTHNRRLSPADVKKLEGAIERGEYKPVTDGIDITVSGLLGDGQHRLEAVAKGDRVVRLLIAENVPDEVQEVTNDNKPRTFGQALQLKGIEKHNQLSPGLRILYNYIHYGVADTQGIQVQPTPTQLWELLAAHPEIEHSAQTVGSNKMITRLLTPGVATALHYLFTRADKTQGDQFFAKLAQGGMSDAAQVNLLHDSLFRGITGSDRLPGKRRSAYAVKAWNAWQDNKKIQMLRWGATRKVGSAYSREKFPIIKNCPIKPNKK